MNKHLRKLALVILATILLALSVLAASSTIILTGAAAADQTTALTNCEAAVTSYTQNNLTTGQTLSCNTCVAGNCTVSNNQTTCLTSCILNTGADDLYVLTKSPSGKQNSGTVELKVTTSFAATCKYSSSNVAYDAMTSAFATTGSTTHTKQLNLPDGSYTYYVQCKTAGGTLLTESAVVSFSLDTQSPSINSYSPTNLVTENYATLQVVTTETAECRQAKTSSGFDSQLIFDTTFATTHTTKIKALSNGANTVYVSCKDLSNNTLENHAVTLRVDLAPSVTIVYDEELPLPAGTTKLTLTVSEDLVDPPLVTYTLSEPGGNSTDSIIVPVQGSGKTWDGYIFISSTDTHKIGKLSFTGTDVEGTTGTRIVSGGTFYVDSLPPPTPTNLNSEVNKEDNELTLTWSQKNSSDIKYYNIYSSSKPGVLASDNYQTTTKQHYGFTRDQNNLFVRVSAVDVFGKESELSEELVVTEGDSTSTTIEATPEAKETSEPEQEINCTAFAKKIGSKIETTQKKTAKLLQSLARYDELVVTGVKKEIKTTETVLHNLEKGINNVDKRACAEKDVSKLKELESETENTSTSLPESIVKTWDFAGEKILEEDKVDGLLNTVFTALGTAEDKKKELKEAAQEHTSTAQTSFSAVGFDVTYKDKVRSFTVISKKISFNNEQNFDMMGSYDLIPDTPETLVAYPKTTSIIGKGIVVSQLQGGTSKEGSYTYAVELAMDAAAVRAIDTVVIPKSVSRSSGNSITGSVIGYVTDGDNMYNFLLGLLGVVVLGVLVHHYSPRNGSGGTAQGKITSRLPGVTELKRFGKRMIPKPRLLRQSPQEKVSASPSTTAGSETLIHQADQYVNSMNLNKAAEVYSNLATAVSNNTQRITPQEHSRLLRLHSKITLLGLVEHLRASSASADASEVKKLVSQLDMHRGKLSICADRDEEKLLRAADDARLKSMNRLL